MAEPKTEPGRVDVVPDGRRRRPQHGGPTWDGPPLAGRTDDGDRSPAGPNAMPLGDIAVCGQA